jgi:hypothetical protein
VVHEESLRNLQYPLDWQGLVDYIGMPCILKDAHGGGWKEVYVCRTLDDLIHHYNESGLLTMIVQEFIEWDHFVRCVALGQRDVLPIKYDPRERRYHVEHGHLTPELGRRIVDDSLTLMRALGYDMCSLEWAVKDGVPYAIDFMNPAPDMDINSLTPHYFEWVVKHMADMAIRLATAPRRPVDLRRGEFLIGRREAADRGWRSAPRGGPPPLRRCRDRRGAGGRDGVGAGRAPHDVAGRRYAPRFGGAGAGGHGRVRGRRRRGSVGRDRRGGWDRGRGLGRVGVGLADCHGGLGARRGRVHEARWEEVEGWKALNGPRRDRRLSRPADRRAGGRLAGAARRPAAPAGALLR